MPKPAPDILTLHAKRTPERAAVIEDPPNGPTTVWGFDELNRQANRLANTLAGLGVRPGEKVIWCGMNSLGVVRIMHAARKIGAVAVPLNYRLSPEEAAYIVDNSDAVLVYADADYVELFAEIRAEIRKLKHVIIFGGAPGPDMLAVDELLDRASDDEPQIDRSGVDGSTMIYTSGTTGHPKGAVRQALGDPELLRQLVALIGYVPEDVYLTTGPLYHSGPGGFMAIAHTLGNTVVLQRRFEPEDWLRLVEEHRVTTTFSAPTPIRMVCDLPAATKARFDRSSMQRMIGNAAPWSFALKQAYLADFPEDSLWEVYGSTELGVNNVLAPEDQLRKPGSCGKAAPGVEIRLLDDDGDEVTEPNVPGELFVRSKAAFSSYYKAHEKFESSRRGEFLTVGDIAYFDREGYYFICDRKNDMIISGGMNIYPAEIESALDHHPEVADVAVIGIPSAQWGESVHAVVVRRGDRLTEDSLLEFAREHLAGYKIPRSVSFSDAIPRNASGKILKKVLREPFWKNRPRQVG
jgi:fatty-acyl-CoA synthase/long-chain acyl-CoA synthetase